MIEPKIYTTRSMAHFDLPPEKYVPNRTPERFDMTYDEAVKDVNWWRNHACTVGGDAIVVRNDGKIFEI